MKKDTPQNGNDLSSPRDEKQAAAMAANHRLIVVNLLAWLAPALPAFAHCSAICTWRNGLCRAKR